jgi:hypothetical protein
MLARMRSPRIDRVSVPNAPLAIRSLATFGTASHGNPSGSGFLFVLLATALTLIAGCAAPPTPGPAFVAAPGPAPGHARLYVYRIDPQHSLATVEIGIDGHKQGYLRNDEYASFELTPGIHRVDFRQRGLAFTSWGWNRYQVHAKEGENVYVEISVRISTLPLPGDGRDLEIGGRGGGSASENVFVQHRSEADALEDLANTTQRVE